MEWLAVGLASMAGAVLRTWFSQLLQQPGGFPYGTLAVNLSGAFILCALVAASPLGEKWKAAVHTGFLGSFTTFSALSSELFLMLEAGRYAEAAFYGFLSLAGGLLAGATGMRLGGKRASG